MEEVPAHVHPGHIIPDVLTRQHSIGLVKKEPLEAWILRAFTGSETDDDLILRSWIYFFTSWRSYTSRFLRNLVHAVVHAALGGARQIGGALVTVQVRDGPVLAVEVLSYPNNEYIRWYRGISRMYIGNLANRDTHSVGYC
ncbi:hypothetical protein M9H77_29462 [Catharanthus roseus]|uniref:Uncharacterized protein n=1 Tax=Catharanthus roseus TaxID=4058 RepID=A0ACB9ZVI1_CATRO|nr:hypothetical protein M9H77_29462 [Catharanthus roseus]